MENVIILVSINSIRREQWNIINVTAGSICNLYRYILIAICSNRKIQSW